MSADTEPDDDMMSDTEKIQTVFGKLQERAWDDQIVADVGDYMTPRTPRPQPPWWRRAAHEIGWRVPHAWRVLIHGDCDGY